MYHTVFFTFNDIENFLDSANELLQEMVTKSQSCYSHIKKPKEELSVLNQGKENFSGCRKVAFKVMKPTQFLNK